MYCKDCKYWDRSRINWLNQFSDDTYFPYDEYGECSNENIMLYTYVEPDTLGVLTHQYFGCIFFQPYQND